MAGYQIKVTMEGTKPPMWRRLQIPDQITFQSLHDILQEAFGWYDAHLHDFTFQNTNVTVGADEDSEYDEAKLLADDFFSAGWIRYTYDFGDDWRHKIVFEKELPDYKERYAQVVKFKRDNFAEDSGGVWADYDYEDEDDGEDGGDVSGEEMFSRTEPYDRNRVNERLKGILCPQKPKARTAEDMGIWVDQKRQMKAGRDKAFEMMRAIGQMLKEADQFDKPAPIDLVEEKGDALWYDFKEQKRWDCRSTERKMNDILQADGTKHLMEMLKYLAVSWEDVVPVIASMAEQVAKIMKEHPEYFICLFSAENMRQYVKWFRGKRMDRLPEWPVLVAFNMWGLVELEIEQDHGAAAFLHINLPPDADSIVEYLEKQGRELDAQERAVNRIWERIKGMLMCYGFIEVQALYEQYKKVFGEISREDFQRHLYLRGSFRREAATGGLRAGNEMEPWAALSMELSSVMTESIEQAEKAGRQMAGTAKGGTPAGEAEAEKFRKKRAELEYAEFTRKQILEMVRDGYASVYPQWESLLVLMQEMLCRSYSCMEEWEAEEILDDWYGEIQLGAGMKALLTRIESEKTFLSPKDWWLLEHTLCRCWSETGIPQLKGHSRLAIAGQTGQSIFAVESEDGYELPDYEKGCQNSASAPQGKMAAGAAGVAGAAEMPGAAGAPASAIDPDDVCPCGSGKRYRQCCGRKKKA